MKIATWNVNGIRAREAQFCEWLDRDRPDVVCLQELKAEPAQVPARCKLDEYHTYWHGSRGYSGVSLHIRKALADAEPQFSHPEFDMETRIVQVALGNLVLASVYVPNGGKDYTAKLEFMRRSPHGPRAFTQRVASSCYAGTSISRAPKSMCIRASASPTSSASVPKSGRYSKSCSAAIWWMWGGLSIPTTSACSRGGHLGAICARGTSGGGWITFWLRKAFAAGRWRARCYRRSGPAITPRS